MSKKSLKRVILVFIALYVVIFACRAVYELTTLSETNNIYWGTYGFPSSHNYVSVPSSDALLIGQKYERIASIVSKTVNFDIDMEQLSATLDKHNAIVQMESSSGLSGSRRIEFVLGVSPENFDELRDDVLQIGRITSSTTTKTDKTDEYLQILAEKESLERRLASYQELKAQAGNVSDLLQLEDRIFDVEARIQQQLIKLGEYSEESALCTVNVALHEVTEPSVLSKLWSALKWSTGTYAIIIAILALTLCSASVITLTYNYLKKMLVGKSADKKQPQTEKQ
ncbi:MAG: DUF4349 domain-containing protein [Dehalococcoidia bacterium]|nr:DUF4349 domain-containing protein [Dehalococcoidia bacterium]